MAHLQLPSPRLRERKREWLAPLSPGKAGGTPRALEFLGGPPQSALPCLPDDNLSGTSGMEVDDRVSALEQRLQLQEDELAVLKAALADALRRLRACEEQGAALRARGTPKGRAPPRLGTTTSGTYLH